MVRKLIGSIVELLVGKLLILKYYCYRIGYSLDLRFEELDECTLRSVDRSCYRSTQPGLVVALLRSTATVRQTPTGRCANGLQQHMEIPEHTVNTSGFE